MGGNDNSILIFSKVNEADTGKNISLLTISNDGNYSPKNNKYYSPDIKEIKKPFGINQK